MHSQQKTLVRASLIVLMSAMICGCYSFRESATASVKDVGDRIVTKYKYRLKNVDGIGVNGFGESGITKIFRKAHPNVFSDNGLPFTLRTETLGSKTKYGWTQVLCAFSLELIPAIECKTASFSILLAMAEDSDTTDSFEIVRTSESAVTVFPTGLIPFGDSPESDGNKIYWKADKIIGEAGYNSRLQAQLDEQIKLAGSFDEYSLKAFSYGVAAKLKEMEDSGKIDSMLRKTEEAKAKVSAVPAHRVVKFAREPKSDFTYGFTLELAEMPYDQEQTKNALMKEFGEAVKEEYADSYPNAKRTSLVFSYSDVKLNGKMIQGKAVVLTITPTSLTYDANTRRGKLAVKFNAGQAEEARAWIRTNIETLARDKNIALVTGQLPPSATYYSLGEKIDGNVMEIEFKTE